MSFLLPYSSFLCADLPQEYPHLALVSHVKGAQSHRWSVYAMCGRATGAVMRRASSQPRILDCIGKFHTTSPGGAMSLPQESGSSLIPCRDVCWVRFLGNQVEGPWQARPLCAILKILVNLAICRRSGALWLAMSGALGWLAGGVIVGPSMTPSCRPCSWSLTSRCSLAVPFSSSGRFSVWVWLLNGPPGWLVVHVGAVAAVEADGFTVYRDGERRT
jgi:hypothetical protein